MRTAIIVAGGSGERFGREGGKQLADVAGMPLFMHSVLVMERCSDIDAIVLVAAPGALEEMREHAASAGIEKLVMTTPGGARRQDSVAAGVTACPTQTSVAVVHDAARPLVTEAVVSAAVEALESDAALSGVVVGHPSHDTLKMVTEERIIISTPDRSSIWAAQTPQVFRIGALRSALRAAEQNGVTVTDDAQAVELGGGRVAMLQGPHDNIKVTVSEDLAVVEAVIATRRG